MKLMTLLSRFSIVALALASCLPPASAEQTFRATTDPVGPNAAGGFETPVNQLVAPAGRQVELPDMRPQALALSPDKRLLVTAEAGVSPEWRLDKTTVSQSVFVIVAAAVRNLFECVPGFIE
ncbi:MAG: hypothetical protein ABSA83_14300 [Verrucomicrobiota bacterium]